MAYWAGENQYVYNVGSYHTIAQAAAKNMVINMDFHAHSIKLLAHIRQLLSIVQFGI